jgi:hypothetical protein
VFTAEQIAHMSRILAADAAQFGLGAALEAPRADAAFRGMSQRYQRGVAATHRSMPAMHGAVWGTIGAAWLAQGGPDGPLGYPIGGEIPLMFPDPADRWARFEEGVILRQARTDTVRTFPGFQGDLPSAGSSDRGRGCAAGIGVPDLQVWFDAAQGVHSFPDRRVSIWHDVIAPRRSAWWTINARDDASTVHSGFWPRIDSLQGRPVVRFGQGEPTGLPFAFDFSGRPYTVFAVVSRDNARGDNHFLFTEGRDCGITGCAADSSLHLGWQGNDNLRFGQYYNDLDLRVPPFRPNTITVVGARSSTGGKLVTADEPGFADFRTNTRPELLRTGGRSYLGCRAFRGPGGPHYHYEGAMFELMIFDAALSDDDYDRVRSGLRRKYGL